MRAKSSKQRCPAPCKNLPMRDRRNLDLKTVRSLWREGIDNDRRMLPISLLISGQENLEQIRV